MKKTFVIGFAILLLMMVAAVSALAASSSGGVASPADEVVCMALHCPPPPDSGFKPPVIPPPVGPITDPATLQKIADIKKKIEALRQEIVVLEKTLYEIYGTPQPPVVPPPPPPPPPPSDFDVQVASLKAAIVKWQKLLDDAASSPADKERAKEEIAILQSSLQKLLDSQDPSKPKPPVVPVDPPKPCLGAYLDASGQLRNACEEVKPPVVPVDPPKPPIVNPEIGGPVVCLALHCPKPADTAAPSAPEKPVASKVTLTSFQVSWTASKDNVAVTGYNVYLDKKFVATVTGTTHNFAGLKANTTYSVTVMAFDAAKNRSPLSVALSVKTTPPPDTTPPSTPDAPVAGTVTKSGFQIMWKPAVDNIKVAGYNVYRNGVYSGTVTTPSFTFRNLTANSNHIITIMAFDDAKNRSVLSKALTVKTASN